MSCRIIALQLSHLAVAFCALASVVTAEPLAKDSRRPRRLPFVDDTVCLIQSRVDVDSNGLKKTKSKHIGSVQGSRRKEKKVSSRNEMQKAADAHGAASKGPFPSGWFGNFDQGESTITDEGQYASQDYPGFSTQYGRDPSLPYSDDVVPPAGYPERFEVRPSRFFHESKSGGPNAAWQTGYPSVGGSIGGDGATDDPWRETPQGWEQEYQPMVEREAEGKSHADWFDNSIRNIDGFGRPMTPNYVGSPRVIDGATHFSVADAEYWQPNGWIERSINSTFGCTKPGCAAAVKLQLYWHEEEVQNCRMTVAVHPTDYDDDWSREHVEFVKINNWLITRQCNPRTRGCNSTAERPLYPCVNGLPIDDVIGDHGQILVEAKNTHMVDECPYNKNLLSGVVMVTCMVRNKTKFWPTTPPPPNKSALLLEAQTGSAVMRCSKPGCEAKTNVNFNPVLALNGGKCLMNVSVRQTDFDDNLGVPEQVDFIKVEGTKTSKGPLMVHPIGKNPCNMRYADKNVTEADLWHLAVKNYDVTKDTLKARPMGALSVSGKISSQVDECGFHGDLFYAYVTVICTPPKHFTAPVPRGALDVNNENHDNEPKRDSGAVQHSTKLSLPR